MTVTLILAIAAIVLAVASAATSKVPLWASVIVLCVIALLQALPLR
jgi:uncharacterized protein (DUF983 family)